ncbi:uncharacterized protein LOC123323020 isoform X2 [Coccinella septempunctata]|uniref:uncharacterized protein LOC123323020 isoform X2 n=1 Tax=Coccinella septempunctata TaxID=41139 RepID=UPI001D08D3CD|nr:uncharacterized protein LOC123323020 isoform X2 [Coccinella septempunctata]
MEFQFNVNEYFKRPIVEIGNTLLPPDFVGDRRALWNTVNKVAEIVNEMGEASAHAQGLNKPITTAERLRQSDQNLYLLVDNDANNGNGAVTGMLKIGRKGLYVFDREGQHYQVTPPCVLDFYVHEKRQRSGLGKKLFEYMLDKENVKPHNLAIDRPSEKFLNFLNKHYYLQNPIKQMNNYVVFDGFFPENQKKELTECSPMSRTNGLQSTQSPNNQPLYGRYGAPRPPCSMGQIIHNTTAQKNSEPTSSNNFKSSHDVMQMQIPSQQQDRLDKYPDQHNVTNYEQQTNMAHRNSQLYQEYPKQEECHNSKQEVKNNMHITKQCDLQNPIRMFPEKETHSGNASYVGNVVPQSEQNVGNVWPAQNNPQQVYPMTEIILNSPHEPWGNQKYPTSHSNYKYQHQNQQIDQQLTMIPQGGSRNESNIQQDIPNQQHQKQNEMAQPIDPQNNQMSYTAQQHPTQQFQPIHYQHQKQNEMAQPIDPQRNQMSYTAQQHPTRQFQPIHYQQHQKQNEVAQPIDPQNNQMSFTAQQNPTQQFKPMHCQQYQNQNEMARPIDPQNNQMSYTAQPHPTQQFQSIHYQQHQKQNEVAQPIDPQKNQMSYTAQPHPTQQFQPIHYQQYQKENEMAQPIDPQNNQLSYNAQQSQPIHYSTISYNPQQGAYQEIQKTQADTSFSNKESHQNPISSPQYDNQIGHTYSSPQHFIPEQNLLHPQQYQHNLQARYGTTNNITQQSGPEQQYPQKLQYRPPIQSSNESYQNTSQEQNSQYIIDNQQNHQYQKSISNVPIHHVNQQSAPPPTYPSEALLQRRPLRTENHEYQFISQKPQRQQYQPSQIRQVQINDAKTQLKSETVHSLLQVDPKYFKPDPIQLKQPYNVVPECPTARIKNDETVASLLNAEQEFFENGLLRDKYRVSSRPAYANHLPSQHEEEGYPRQVQVARDNRHFYPQNQLATQALSQQISNPIPQAIQQKSFQENYRVQRHSGHTENFGNQQNVQQSENMHQQLVPRNLLPQEQKSNNPFESHISEQNKLNQQYTAMDPSSQQPQSYIVDPNNLQYREQQMTPMNQYGSQPQPHSYYQQPFTPTQQFRSSQISSEKPTERQSREAENHINIQDKEGHSITQYRALATSEQSPMKSEREHPQACHSDSVDEKSSGEKPTEIKVDPKDSPATIRQGSYIANDFVTHSEGPNRISTHPKSKLSDEECVTRKKDISRQYGLNEVDMRGKSYKSAIIKRPTAQ